MADFGLRFGMCVFAHFGNLVFCGFIVLFVLGFSAFVACVWVGVLCFVICGVGLMCLRRLFCGCLWW